MGTESIREENYCGKERIEGKAESRREV